jgi:carbon-monoxide dehydrogenase medium subunit
VEHAIALLAQYQGEARIIAGGQSLIPMLAYRLAAPAALIDIGRLADLATIRLDDQGLSIGSLTRWCDIQCSTEIRTNHPSECPAVVLACKGEIIVQGSNGARSVRAEDFFQGLLSTDLQDDEVITSIKLPPWNPKRLWAFSEFSRRTGDFALAGVAIHFEMVSDCFSVPSIVGFGVGDRALVLRATQDALEFNAPEPETIARAISIAREEIDPPVDPHASPDYRRALFGVLLERALKEALGRNRGLIS